MTAAEIPPPPEYDVWLKKTNEFQNRFNDAMKELDAIQFSSQNLNVEFPKLQRMYGTIKAIEKDFATWWTETENLGFHFWDKIPPNVTNQIETLHYDIFLMLRTTNLKGQLVQIMNGYNLKSSEYQWWKAYNKAMLGLKVAKWALIIAIIGVVAAVIVPFILA